MSGAIKWLIYILVQLRSCSVVAYGIAFLEMGFNHDECSSIKSTLKNILFVEPAYTITSTAKDSIVIEQDAKYTEVY